MEEIFQKAWARFWFLRTRCDYSTMKLFLD